MNITEMQEQLAKLEAALVEKGGVRPSNSFNARVDGFYVSLQASGVKFKNGLNYVFCRGKTIEHCFALAWEEVRSLPDAEETVQREYLTRVSSAIDYATENSLPDEYVAPLRGVSAAMTDNLLTKDTDQ